MQQQMPRLLTLLTNIVLPPVLECRRLAVGMRCKGSTCFHLIPASPTVLPPWLSYLLQPPPWTSWGPALTPLRKRPSQALSKKWAAGASRFHNLCYSMLVLAVPYGSLQLCLLCSLGGVLENRFYKAACTPCIDLACNFNTAVTCAC